MRGEELVGIGMETPDSGDFVATSGDDPVGARDVDTPNGGVVVPGNLEGFGVHDENKKSYGHYKVAGQTRDGDVGTMHNNTEEREVFHTVNANWSTSVLFF